MAREQEHAFVEKIGRYFEQLSLPRMAGRIFGRLLIAESPQEGMSELVDALGASRSSISSMTRLLIQTGLIEIVSLPKDRRDHYRIRTDAWTNALKDRLAQATAFRALAEEGLRVLSGSSSQRRRQLDEMRAMYAFLEEEIPVLLARWQRLRQGIAREKRED